MSPTDTLRARIASAHHSSAPSAAQVLRDLGSDLPGRTGWGWLELVTLPPATIDVGAALSGGARQGDEGDLVHV